MLLEKFKNTTPAPQPRQMYLTVVKSALISFVATTAIIFTVYCQISYNRSFDNCEKLLAEVHTNLGLLHTELADLKASMGAGAVNHE